MDEWIKRLELLAFEHKGTCLRKTVFCVILDDVNEIIAFNGGGHCMNIVGNCGCAHAEPRAIMRYIKKGGKKGDMVCLYSPCTFCAHVIVDSEVIEQVFYRTLTEHDRRGTWILDRAGIPCIRVGVAG